MPWKCFLDILCQAGKGVHVWATSGSRMGWLNLEGVFHSCCSISVLTISVHSVFRGTSWRRPALETRHWHLVSANLCDLKIGYLCSSHFIGEEPFTAHLFFSTKFRFKRQSTTSGRDLGVSSCRVNGGTVDHRWMAERSFLMLCDPVLPLGVWPSMGRCLEVVPTWRERWGFSYQSYLVVLEERSSMVHSLYFFWRIIHGWPFFRYQIWP